MIKILHQQITFRTEKYKNDQSVSKNFKNNYFFCSQTVACIENSDLNFSFVIVLIWNRKTYKFFYNMTIVAKFFLLVASGQFKRSNPRPLNPLLFSS